MSQDLQYLNAVILIYFNKQDSSNVIEYDTLVQETGLNDFLESDIVI